MKENIYLSHLKFYQGNDKFILSDICDMAFYSYKAGREGWVPTGEIIASSYKRCSEIEFRAPQTIGSDKPALSLEAAEWIREKAEEMPITILRVADDILASEAGNSTVKVGHTAQDAGWLK